MASKTKFNSLREFYPFYLTEHSDFVCRTLHFIGTGLVIALAITGVATFNWKFFVMMPIAGYGFAWVGHFFFEKNKPAAWSKPLWAKACDWVMLKDILTGKIEW